jgi:hypothetical protein
MDKAGFEEKQARLIEEINSAFNGVSRQGSIGIHEADASFEYVSPGGVKKARHKDQDTRWKDAEVDSIELWARTLRHMDFIGYRYYLPAFAVHCLRHGDESYLVDLLREPRWKILSKSQNRVIARCLQFLAECADWEAEEYLRKQGYSDEEIAPNLKWALSEVTEKNLILKALEDYWGQFLESPEQKFA